MTNYVLPLSLTLLFWRLLLKTTRKDKLTQGSELLYVISLSKLRKGLYNTV